MTLHIYDHIDSLFELRKMHLAFMTKKKYFLMEEEGRLSGMEGGKATKSESTYHREECNPLPVIS